MHFRGFSPHDDLLSVLRDADILDFADFHGLVADLGLVRLEIVGGAERDFDAGALRDLLANGDERPDQDHDRQYPDERHAQAPRRIGHGRRQIVGRRSRSAIAVVSHSSRSSNDWAASIVSTTTARERERAGPHVNDASDLDLHERHRACDTRTRRAWTIGR